MIEKTECYLSRFSLTQLFQYCFIGGIAALLQCLLLIVIVDRHLANPLIANGIGFFVGFCVALVGHKKYTFSNTEQSLKIVVPGFLLLSFIGFALNQFLFYVFWHTLHIQYFLSLLLVLTFVAVLSFLSNKLIVFKN